MKTGDHSLIRLTPIVEELTVSHCLIQSQFSPETDLQRWLFDVLVLEKQRHLVLS